MSTVFEIPLIPTAQKLSVDINGLLYTLHVRWNQYMRAWILDIHDENDVVLPGGLNGVALVPGTDILGQFRYLGIGGGVPMLIMTIGPGKSPDELPTTDNLGTEARL